MHLAIPHHTTRATARGKIESLLTDLQKKHGHMVTDLEQHWEGDQLVFQFKAKGFKVNGSLEVTDKEVILNGSLPLLARAFESRIKEAVVREAQNHFPTA